MEFETFDHWKNSLSKHISLKTQKTNPLSKKTQICVWFSSLRRGPALGSTRFDQTILDPALPPTHVELCGSCTCAALNQTPWRNTMDGMRTPDLPHELHGPAHFCQAEDELVESIMANKIDELDKV